jgi:hypothetical protein
VLLTVGEQPNHIALRVDGVLVGGTHNLGGPLDDCGAPSDECQLFLGQRVRCSLCFPARLVLVMREEVGVARGVLLGVTLAPLLLGLKPACLWFNSMPRDGFRCSLTASTGPCITQRKANNEGNYLFAGIVYDARLLDGAAATIYPRVV